MECSHPNRITGADGVTRCLTCGRVVEPIQAKADAEPETKPVKRTAKKKADQSTS